MVIHVATPTLTGKGREALQEPAPTSKGAPEFSATRLVSRKEDPECFAIVHGGNSSMTF